MASSSKAFSTDFYKETERRLYAIPILKRKVQNDKELLGEILTQGPQERSKSLVRFQKTGYRLNPEEMLDATINELKATIAVDEHEIQTVSRALEEISGDQYYVTIIGRYMDGVSDEVVADRLGCDPSTAWRKRRRLVRKLSILLYGAVAV